MPFVIRMSEVPSEYLILIEDLNIIKKTHSTAVELAVKEGRNPDICMNVKSLLQEINTLCNTIEEYIFNNSRYY
jgi:hypothetical protein